MRLVEKLRTDAALRVDHQPDVLMIEEVDVGGRL